MERPPLPEFLVTELKLTKIVTAIQGGYDIGSGIDESGGTWTFMTNTDGAQSLPPYFTAIKRAKLEDKFAIGVPQDGFNEEEGYSFPANPNHVGVYHRCSPDELQRYHRFHHDVDKQLKPYLQSIGRMWL